LRGSVVVVKFICYVLVDDINIIIYLSNLLGRMARDVKLEVWPSFVIIDLFFYILDIS
jgi:hypothetical protein